MQLPELNVPVIVEKLLGNGTSEIVLAKRISDTEFERLDISKYHPHVIKVLFNIKCVISWKYQIIKN